MRAIALPTGACWKLDAKCYVQDGLAYMIDAIDNAPNGAHFDGERNSLYELVSGTYLTTTKTWVFGKDETYYNGDFPYPYSEMLSLGEVPQFIKDGSFTVENVAMDMFEEHPSWTYITNYSSFYTTGTIRQIVNGAYVDTYSGINKAMSGLYRASSGIQFVQDWTTTESTGISGVINAFNGWYKTGIVTGKRYSTSMVRTPKGISGWELSDIGTYYGRLNNTGYKTVSNNVSLSYALVSDFGIMYCGRQKNCCLRIYNRPLTEAEMQYNYSIDQQRFGLS